FRIVGAPVHADGSARQVRVTGTQPRMAEAAGTVVGPVHHQFVSMASQGGRNHYGVLLCNWFSAMRTALRTSGSLSPAAACNGGTAERSASSPSRSEEHTSEL